MSVQEAIKTMGFLDYEGLKLYHVNLLTTMNTALLSKADVTKIVNQKSNATILPNALNVWKETITSSVTITKGGSNADTVNHYMIRYTAGEGGQIIFDTSWGSLKWHGGDKPEWIYGYTYEISIVDNIALWAEIEPTT